MVGGATVIVAGVVAVGARVGVEKATSSVGVEKTSVACPPQPLTSSATKMVNKERRICNLIIRVSFGIPDDSYTQHHSSSSSLPASVQWFRLPVSFLYVQIG